MNFNFSNDSAAAKAERVGSPMQASILDKLEVEQLLEETLNSVSGGIRQSRFSIMNVHFNM
jgi:translation initiation factor RLI1